MSEPGFAQYNEDTIYGVPIPSLPDGYQASEAVVLVRAHNFDAPNPTMYFEFKTAGLSKTEALGMLVTASDSMRDMLRNNPVAYDAQNPHEGHDH